MKPILLAATLGLSSLLWTSCGAGVAAPVTSAKVTQGAEEQSLFDALNAARKRAGKPALQKSAELQAMARGEAQAVSAGGRFAGNNTEAIRLHSTYNWVGKLHGQLKDRGPQTGAAFVDYWAKENREMVDGQWSHGGVGVSRTAGGKLVAVVLFGANHGPAGGSGGMLLEPAARFTHF